MRELEPNAPTSKKTVNTNGLMLISVRLIRPPEKMQVFLVLFKKECSTMAILPVLNL